MENGYWAKDWIMLDDIGDHCSREYKLIHVHISSNVEWTTGPLNYCYTQNTCHNTQIVCSSDFVRLPWKSLHETVLTDIICTMLMCKCTISHHLSVIEQCSCSKLTKTHENFEPQIHQNLFIIRLQLLQSCSVFLRTVRCSLPHPTCFTNSIFWTI